MRSTVIRSRPSTAEASGNALVAVITMITTDITTSNLRRMMPASLDRIRFGCDDRLPRISEICQGMVGMRLPCQGFRDRSCCAGLVRSCVDPDLMPVRADISFGVALFMPSKHSFLAPQPRHRRTHLCCSYLLHRFSRRNLLSSCVPNSHSKCAKSIHLGLLPCLSEIPLPS